MKKLQIKKATRLKKKVRFAMSGVSGSGKTYSDLLIALELCKLLYPNEEPRILLGDTENESSTCYADGNPFVFDIVVLEPPFHPDQMIEFLRMCQGYHVGIVDSMSHFYMGEGGILDLHDQATKRHRGNSFTAWKEVTPIYNRLIDAVIRCPAHLFGTLRAKSEYIQTEENGKKSVEKVGLGAQMRDGFEFEFDHHGRLDLSNTMIMEKTRCSELNGRTFSRPGRQVAEILAKWCTLGVEADMPPIPAPPDPREGQRGAYVSKIKTLANKIWGAHQAFRDEDGGEFMTEFDMNSEDLETVGIDTLITVGLRLKELSEAPKALVPDLETVPATPEPEPQPEPEQPRAEAEPTPLFKDLNRDLYVSMKAKLFATAGEVWPNDTNNEKLYSFCGQHLATHPTENRPSISLSTEKQLSAAIKAVGEARTRQIALTGTKN